VTITMNSTKPAIQDLRLSAKNGACLFATRTSDVFFVGTKDGAIAAPSNYYFNKDACLEAVEFFQRLADDL